MEKSAAPIRHPGNAAVSITRRYNTPAEKVWRAWTDPQAIAQWFGPDRGSVVTVADMDVRAGGRYHLRFGVPGQEVHDVGGTYLVVEPFSKLVFDWTWKSTPERSSLVTIVLRPSGAGTDMTFLHERFADQAACDGHDRGWAAAFIKLDKLLTTAG